MNGRSFKSINGLELIVKNRKSAVILEVGQNHINEKYNLIFEFTNDVWNGLLNYIETLSYKLWPGLTPRKAESLGADYYEYYDRKLDNNGYLTIKKNTLLIERPALDSERLYQFNKKKWNHSYMTSKSG